LAAFYVPPHWATVLSYFNVFKLDRLYDGRKN
jgi:hypothetical protein